MGRKKEDLQWACELAVGFMNNPSDNWDMAAIKKAADMIETELLTGKEEQEC